MHGAGCGMNDREIIEMFLRRDPKAPEEAAKRYSEVCRGTALRMLRDPGEAEECVNDALMRAWQSIPPAEPQSLEAYLLKAVRNVALNRLARDRAEKRGGGEAHPVLSELSDIVSGEFDPEAELIKKEMAASVSAFLRRLPEKQRAMFIKRYWHFMPVEEIAAELGCAPSGVYSALARTRAKLEKYLRKEGYDV